MTVALIGPESTGKTALAQRLAEHYDCIWIPEYARSYIAELNRPYTYNDVVEIAHTQIEIEEKTIAENKDKRYLFFDTELIITKVWLLHVFKQCPDWLEAHLQAHPMDFYLLCRPDLPWQPDAVRENGHLRSYFFDWYEREIKLLNRPYAVVTGTGNERIKNAEKQLQLWKNNY